MAEQKKRKMFWKRALKIARANGYDGPETFEAVKEWAESCMTFDDGATVEVVKTVTVIADAGENVVIKAGAATDEDEMETEAKAEDSDEDEDEEFKTVKAADLRRLREKARRADAGDAVSASGVNRVTAAVTTTRDAKSYAIIAAKKAYNLRANRGETVWSDADEADAYGAWMRLQVYGWREYTEKARDKDIVRKTGITTTFTSTGALVPPQFVDRLIDIRRQYGVVERIFYNQPMTSDTAHTPRRTGGLTVYTPGEAGAITASDPSYDQVLLTARKRATLTKVSSESMNDAAFSMADLVANEIAWAFAKDDDNRGINGDGSSTYAGDVGLRAKIKGLSGTIANIAGLKVGAGNLYSELTWADFLDTQSLLPEFAGAPGAPRWLMHPRFYQSVPRQLAHAAGGMTATERLDGTTRTLLDGYEVVFSEQMPRAQDNSQVCALFGHFSMAATFGRVRSMEIATSRDSDFANDLIAIRGTQRTAINVHDVGNASATESEREPGPVVGLITAAS